jgi:nucleotide-binding universal stress UspA family protein
MDQDTTIVVGVDGSPASMSALRWAVDRAKPGATIRAVHVWGLPAMSALPGPLGTTSLPLDALEENARVLLDAAIGAVVPDPAAASIEPVLREGPGAGTLLEEADGADLLVVGARGVGGFRGLLVGSVADQVVKHAKCPVVIVPAPEEDEG